MTVLPRHCGADPYLQPQATGMFRNYLTTVSRDSQILQYGPFFPGISGTRIWTRPVG